MKWCTKQFIMMEEKSDLRGRKTGSEKGSTIPRLPCKAFTPSTRDTLVGFEAAAM